MKHSVSFLYTSIVASMTYRNAMQPNCVLISDENGIKTYSSDDMDDIKITFSVVDIDGMNYLHHPSKPSWIRHHDVPEYEFFVHGFRCLIKNLPISDEEKCILVLKYVDDGNGNYS